MASESTQRVVVLGATGTVGSALARELATFCDVEETGHQRQPAGGTQLDLRDAEATAAYLSALDPETVILCSALSNVAACEADPAKAHALNVGAVETVAAACRERRLVFFSSDAVFSDARELWSEEHEPDPPSVYGQQKAQAESIVQEECANHLIVRTARVYARERGDGKFVDFVIRTLQDGGQIRAPRRTPGNPTLLNDLTAGVVQLMTEGQRGLWHVAGPPVASLYETALTIADTCGFDRSKVTPIGRDDGSEMPRITAVLDTSKARDAGLQFTELAAGLDPTRADV